MPLTWVWPALAVVVLGLLALDLGAFHRRARRFSVGEAVGWTVLWIALALFFNALVYLLYENQWLGVGRALGHALPGREAALLFFTTYLLEKSLSVGNVFVIAMVFSHFRVPAEDQRRVLLWGILGALGLRVVMIGGGVLLIERYAWLVYVFGSLLIATAVRMLVVRHDTLEPERNPLIRLLRRRLPVTGELHGPRLLIDRDGRRLATPLALAAAMVGTTDLLFAADSVSAAFAVTLDPFLVVAANIFAVLGLRSLFFAVAAMMRRFAYLKNSLVFALAFVGVKMILTHSQPIPAVVTLAVIGTILGVGVAASVLVGEGDPAALASPLESEAATFYRLTVRVVRRASILIAGSTLLLIGAALLVLPGPGILTMMAGLGVLATEYLWARLLLARARRRASEAAADVRRWVGNRRRRS